MNRLLGLVLVPILVNVGCRDAGRPSDSVAVPSSNRSPQSNSSPVNDRPAVDATSDLVPRFTEVAQQAGIVFQRYDDIRGLHRLFEGTGGGVALIDYDGDNLLDVLLTNGCQVPFNNTDRVHPTELFRNLGDGKFQRVTEQSGLLQYGYAQGCAVGDFNNDGFPDVYIAAFGPNSLWQNNGDGTFTDVTQQSGVNCPLWSTSAGWGDFNRDGLLDLYVTNYVLEDDESPKLCPREDSPDGYVQCPPTMFEAAADVLYLNLGDGQFRDVTAEAGITGVDGKGLGLAIFDMDHDGRLDIYVANDGTPNFLYVNQTPQSKTEESPQIPQFQEQAMLLGAALNKHGLAEASMGVACGDYDGDGWLDLFVTHFFAETNTLYRNLGGEGFSDETTTSRLGPPSRLKLGFGTEFIDFDNNGRLDLFVSNGHIDDFTWLNPREAYRMPPQFFLNEGSGEFRDVSQSCGSYFQSSWLGRPAAIGDLDNDGDMDIVVGHQLAPSAVLRNDTAATAESVTLTLVGGPHSNRSAIGARVEAQWEDHSVTRQVLGASSFQTSSDRRIHIGLGSKPNVPLLQITWPSGAVDTFSEVASGFYVAEEGKTGLMRVPQTPARLR